MANNVGYLLPTLDEHGGASSLNPDEITPETFRLPTLASKLAQLAEVIHSGQGFFVIRGLDSERYSPIERLVAFAGLTSYVGQSRACQDAGGSKLSESPARLGPSSTRGAHEFC